MNYLEKIRKSRHFTKEINGHKFTLSRPTDADAAGMVYKSVKSGLIGCAEFVVDWDFTELDLFPGGTGEPVPFSKELFLEWVMDNPPYWKPIISALYDEHKAYRKKEDERGNV